MAELAIFLEAAGTGDFETLWLLLLADPRLKDMADRRGFTALMRGAQYGQRAVVYCLIGLSANVSACTNFGYTALHFACAHGDADIVTLLLEMGGHAGSLTINGRTPLIMASCCGRLHAVDVLMRHGGTDVDHQDCRGMTALHVAARWGFAGISGKLLDAGADPQLRNRRGATALDIARAHLHMACVTLLEANEKVFLLTRARRHVGDLRSSGHDFGGSQMPMRHAPQYLAKRLARLEGRWQVDALLTYLSRGASTWVFVVHAAPCLLKGFLCLAMQWPQIWSERVYWYMWHHANTASCKDVFPSMNSCWTVLLAYIWLCTSTAVLVRCAMSGWRPALVPLATLGTGMGMILLGTAPETAEVDLVSLLDFISMTLLMVAWLFSVAVKKHRLDVLPNPVINGVLAATSACMKHERSLAMQDAVVLQCAKGLLHEHFVDMRSFLQDDSAF